MSEKGQVRVDDLVIDLDHQSLKRNGESIEMPDLSFRLFSVLIRHAPHNVTKDDLINEVWGHIVVSDETLAQRVRLLRQSLGEDSQNPRYISSVRGRGYRLICEVTTSDFEDQGNRRLWVLGIATAAFLAGFAIWWIGSELNESQFPIETTSIAVLPFTDLSPGQNYGYFADGMQEELLTRLTKLKSIEVLSRTSVENYRSTKLSLPEIAKAVGVGLIIEGSVRIAEDRVRITVQLIDAKTDRHLWAESFESELSMQSIFSIQQEVAEQIAQTLKLEDKVLKAAKPGEMPTDNLEAYEAFLLGRYHTFRQTPKDLALAVAFLKQATSLDPEFAEAYTALGWAYSFLGTSYGKQRPADVYPKARQAALTALSLNSELANARSLYADILTWYDWDFVAAEREHLKAVKLDPLNVLGYALFLSTQQRHDEAIREIEKRLKAYPNDSYTHVNAGWRFFSARLYDRAIEEATLAKDHADARSVLAFANLEMGRTELAIELFELDARQRENPQQLANLAHAYFRTGHLVEGEQVLGRLLSAADKEFVSPAVIASVYFAADRADEGFVLLQEAVAVRAREMIFIQVDHIFDEYREDPRYLDLIRTIGFQGSKPSVPGPNAPVKRFTED